MAQMIQLEAETHPVIPNYVFYVRLSMGYSESTKLNEEVTAMAINDYHFIWAFSAVITRRKCL